jgi:CBS domain containing-hemolysin-like protein
MGSSFLLVLVALVLVVLNGVFVAAEFGLVKLRQNRVKAIAKTYGWRGRILAKAHLVIFGILQSPQINPEFRSTQ